MTHESIYIIHAATDEDGSLRIAEEHGEFVDSKIHSDVVRAIAAVRVEQTVAISLVCYPVGGVERLL